MINLTKTIKWTLNIAWYASLVFMVYIFVGLLLMIFTGSKEFYVLVPADLGIAEKLNNGNRSNVQLVYQEALLQVRDNSFEFISLFIYRILVEAGLALAIIFLLRRIFSELLNRNFFAIVNAKYLRWIGLACIAYLPLKILQLLLFSAYLKAKAADIGYQIVIFSDWANYKLAENQIGLNPDFEFDLLFIGAVILVFSEIFRQGVTLREENEAFV